MVITQNYNRSYGPSPKFTYKNDVSISSIDPIIIDWETKNPRSQKYYPFNYTQIVNNSEVGFSFYANQKDDKFLYCPGGSIQNIDVSFFPAIRSYKIVPESAVEIPANKIIITSSNQGQTTDSIAERVHKRLFGNRGL